VSLHVAPNPIITPVVLVVDVGHCRIDPQGFAGLEDRIDRHWRQLASAAVVSTLLGVGTELGAGSDDSDIVRALRQGAANSINQVGQQVVGKSLDIQPTLTVRPGFPVRVIITRDLVLEPFRN